METENTAVRLWVTAAAALETLATYYAASEGDNSAYESIMSLYHALNILEKVIENGGVEHIEIYRAGMGRRGKDGEAV